MTQIEAINKLNLLSTRDNEDCHYSADNILLEYLKANNAENLAGVYINLRKEVEFWY